MMDDTQPAQILMILSDPVTWMAIAAIVLCIMIWRGRVQADANDQPLWAHLGVSNVPRVIRLGGAGLWTLLFVIFFTAIVWIAGYLSTQITWDSLTGQDQTNDLRWYLLTLTAMTTVLGAVIALPFTLIRTKNLEAQTKATQQQTHAALDGLVTDRLNKAVEGLGAQKEVNRLGRNVFYQQDGKEFSTFQWEGDQATSPSGAEGTRADSWSNIAITEPNLEVRIGSIYALERIAKENKDYHVQVMEILCAYVRENAPASEAKEWPELEMRESEEDGPLEADFEGRMDAFRSASDALKETVKPRSDIQTALTVIGRRSAEQRQWEAEADGGKAGDAFVFDEPCPEYSGDENAPLGPEWQTFEAAVKAWKERLRAYEGYRLDLRGTNLQGADLAGLALAGARLDAAQMQGAGLRRAKMQGADLEGAKMQQAYLSGAQMQGAGLIGAKMQGAGLGRAQMQGANLRGAQMQGAGRTNGPPGTWRLMCTMNGTNGAMIRRGISRQSLLGRPNRQRTRVSPNRPPIPAPPR